MQKAGSKNYADNSLVKEMIFFPGEQIVQAFEKVVYILPDESLFEGKLAITNYRLRFSGVSFTSLRSSTEVLLLSLEPALRCYLPI